MNLDELNPKVFSRLLKVRTAFKSISQISWSINQLEKRYLLESTADADLKDILDAYKDQYQVLANAMVELAELFDEDTNGKQKQ